VTGADESEVVIVGAVVGVVVGVVVVGVVVVVGDGSVTDGESIAVVAGALLVGGVSDAT
jgi:hypothetical protein